MRLTEAQRRALKVFADGRHRKATEAAALLGIQWPASGNFAVTVRNLYLKGALSIRWSPTRVDFAITEAGRRALEQEG